MTYVSEVSKLAQRLGASKNCKHTTMPDSYYVHVLKHTNASLIVSLKR